MKALSLTKNLLDGDPVESFKKSQVSQWFVASLIKGILTIDVNEPIFSLWMIM